MDGSRSRDRDGGRYRGKDRGRGDGGDLSQSSSIAKARSGRLPPRAKAMMRRVVRYRQVTRYRPDRDTVSVSGSQERQQLDVDCVVVTY